MGSAEVGVAVVDPCAAAGGAARVDTASVAAVTLGMEGVDWGLVGLEGLVAWAGRAAARAVTKVAMVVVAGSGVQRAGGPGKCRKFSRTGAACAGCCSGRCRVYSDSMRERRSHHIRACRAGKGAGREPEMEVDGVAWVGWAAATAERVGEAGGLRAET